MSGAGGLFFRGAPSWLLSPDIVSATAVGLEIVFVGVMIVLQNFRCFVTVGPPEERIQRVISDGVILSLGANLKSVKAYGEDSALDARILCSSEEACVGPILR
jgi:hypothetical protein